MTVFATTRVAILDVRGERVGTCRGPRPHGRCSAGSGDEVACADHLLVAEVAGDRRRFRHFVPVGLDRCPLAPPARLPIRERRDPELRALRGAVASWFGLHPVSLAALDEPTVTRMLTRIGGGHSARSTAAQSKTALGHRWAGDRKLRG